MDGPQPEPSKANMEANPIAPPNSNATANPNATANLNATANPTVPANLAAPVNQQPTMKPQALAMVAPALGQLNASGQFDLIPWITDIQGPVVSVSSGSDTQITYYTLHMRLLSKYSKFFADEIQSFYAESPPTPNKKRKTSPGRNVVSAITIDRQDYQAMVVASRRGIQLPMVDPMIFDLFVAYIYTGTYPIVDHQEKDAYKGPIVPSVLAWVLGSIVGAPEFQDYAMRHIYHSMGRYFVLTPDLLRFVWVNTMPAVPDNPELPRKAPWGLRKLVIDILAVYLAGAPAPVMHKSNINDSYWMSLIMSDTELQRWVLNSLFVGASIKPVNHYFNDPDVAPKRAALPHEQPRMPSVYYMVNGLVEVSERAKQAANREAGPEEAAALQESVTHGLAIQAANREAEIREAERREDEARREYWAQYYARQAADKEAADQEAAAKEADAKEPVRKPSGRKQAVPKRTSSKRSVSKTTDATPGSSKQPVTPDTAAKQRVWPKHNPLLTLPPPPRGYVSPVPRDDTPQDVTEDPEMMAAKALQAISKDAAAAGAESAAERDANGSVDNPVVLKDTAFQGTSSKNTPSKDAFRTPTRVAKAPLPKAEHNESPTVFSDGATVSASSP